MSDPPGEGETSVRVIGLRASGGPLFGTAVPLRPGLTVLYGLNGAGKTRILDALHSCLTGQRRGLNGDHLSVESDAVLFVECDRPRDEGVQGFMRVPDRLGLHRHPELLDPFVQEMADSSVWGFSPGWGGDASWFSYLATSPEPGSATFSVYEDDRAITSLLRALDVNDWEEAQRWVDEIGLTVQVDSASGEVRTLADPDDPRDVDELVGNLEFAQVFDAYPNGERGVPIDLHPLADLDGLPLCIRDTEGRSGERRGPDCDLVVESGPQDPVGAVLRKEEPFWLGKVFLQGAADAWYQFPQEPTVSSPDDEEPQGAQLESAVPFLSELILSRLVLRLWAARVSEIANQLLDRLLLEPPRLVLELHDDTARLFAGTALTWSTEAGLVLEELSRAERRWATFAIRLAVLATVRTEGADDRSVDDLLGLQRPTFLLLDEPESALHRTAERHMADGLLWLSQQPNLFVVAATHSPHLLDSSAASVFRVHHVEREIIEGGRPTVLRRARTTELTTAPRREMQELGLQPSDLLARHKAFLLVEGHHDEVVLRTLVGDQLDQLRVEVLPIRGARNLAATVDSRFLWDFTDATVIPVLDNTSADDVLSAWNRALTVCFTEGPEAAGEFLRQALPAKESVENMFLQQFLSRAIELDIRSRVAPFALSAPDIVHYLPLSSFVAKPGQSWMGLWTAHEVALTSGETKIRDAKTWIERTYATDFSTERLEGAARQLGEVPTDIAALVIHCDLVVNGLAYES